MNPGLKCLLIATVSLLAVNCADDAEPTYDSGRILECHNNQAWGLDATEEKIVGTWEWKHAEYIYAVPYPNDLTGMKIEFRDGTGTLTYSKVAPLEFTWSIGAYGTYFGFTTDPLIPQLTGQILFCGKQMVCGIGASGLADGVNNYYEKVE